jgi:signal transduction histidine kinase
MQLNNGEGSLVGQLIKTKGTVIYKASDLVFLQDGDDGIRVLLRDESNVGIGDVVEAVGLPQPDGFSPQLAKAVLHKVGHVALPEPKAFDVSDLSQADSLIDMDATRGWLDATLVGVSADDSLRVLQFRIESSDKTFSAFLPSSGEGLASLEPGSRVRLMGVFKAKVSSAPDFGQVISSFEMYLNAPDDITVLARPPWWTLGHTLGLLGGLGLVLLLALAWAGQLHRKVAQRTRELSEEITERKRIQAEADKAHRDLVVAARQAGMAEVAIGVLHNVGNVLNSVNVSATIVVDRIRHLKVSGLAKSIQLLRQHETNLTHFLSHDDKGKRLMPYMEKLAGHLESEQAGALQELENLSRNVEHIKDIVTVQQNYATYAGLTEPLQMVDLVEDALRMNASSLERHDVHIVREFDEEPPKVNADKHKILQILVNIVRNAQQACQESGREDKKVVIRVANGDGTIKVSTTDNGVGIAPENVSRIFNHGFTTRKDGHGFGLHTSALAAKEMGGILRFSSPGPGRGATFTLELPVAH